MKLKDVEGLVFAYSETDREYDKGWNRAVDIIGEKELEVDVEKITNILIKYLNYLSIHYLATGNMTPAVDSLAAVIAKEFPVRVKL